MGDSVVFIDAQSSEIKSSLNVDGSVYSIDFAPCGNKFAIACNNYLSSSYSVQIFSQDGSTGNFACQSTLNVDAGIGGVQSVSFSPSGDMVAAGCYNGKIHFMDAAAGQIKSSVNVGYAFSRFSTRIFLPARPLFSRFSTRISV